MAGEILQQGIQSLTNIINRGVKFAEKLSNEYIGPLCYPIELLSEKGARGNSESLYNTRPRIEFICHDKKSLQPKRYIVFPLPAGLEFNDGASYDDTALGLVGSALTGVVKKSGGDLTKAGEAARGEISKIVGNAQSNPSGAISAALSGIKGIPGGSVIGTALGVGTGNVVNPHIITTFTGVSTRTFAFKFKMIANSKEQSEVIRKICHSFRLATYPAADFWSLKYPATWNIKFMLGNKNIKYIPKIFECYLQSTVVTYNNSSHTFHEDGSPLECDLTLTFKETRALNANDIEELHNIDDISKGKFGDYTVPPTRNPESTPEVQPKTSTDTPSMTQRSADAFMWSQN